MVLDTLSSMMTRKRSLIQKRKSKKFGFDNDIDEAISDGYHPFIKEVIDILGDRNCG